MASHNALYFIDCALLNTPIDIPLSHIFDQKHPHNLKENIPYIILQPEGNTYLQHANLLRIQVPSKKVKTIASALKDKCHGK